MLTHQKPPTPSTPEEHRTEHTLRIPAAAKRCEGDCPATREGECVYEENLGGGGGEIETIIKNKEINLPHVN